MIMHTTPPNFTLPPSRQLALAPEVKASFAWIKTYADENGLSRKDLSRLLAYDESTICRIYGENYTGNPTNIVAAINRFRTSLLAKIGSPSEFPFTQTAVSRTIHDYIDLAVKWRKIGIIIAESQTGKTRSAKAYQAPEGRPLIYLRLKDGGHKSKVVLRFCKRVGVSDKYNTPKREERIEEFLTRDHIVIIDELQQCAARQRAGGRMSAERIDTIEWLRDMKDEIGFAMIFIGTTEALRMLKGENIQGIPCANNSGHILIQTLKRSLDPLILRNNPPKRDLDNFARRVGLDPAEGKALEIQSNVVVVRGLEVWLTYLLAGAEIAAHQNRAITWGDVLAAYKTFTGSEA